MATNKVEQPYPIYNDKNGTPLEDGYIYIGTDGLDAVDNQIAIYSDSGLSSSLSQPVRTSGGFPVSSSAIVKIYAGAKYSITVKDKNGQVVYSSLSEGS